jgi:nanoRNase/pAp phosphatase (c-di-AMP/oligoRNAs hydrolase)
VGRSENKAMLRYLRVKPMPAEYLDYSTFDLVCVVDSQPSTGYVSLPDGIKTHVVFDHHPMREEIPGSLLVEVDETAGSTCTMMGETFLSNGIPIRADIATGLVYGIKAETQDLGRETTQRDVEVYTQLYPLANKRLLSMIEQERVTERYFTDFARALEHARVHDYAILSDLGEVGVPDIVPETADFLLRLEGMKWSCVVGSFGDKLYVSVRASDPSLRADRVLRRAMRGMGACGGHGQMAGGQIPLMGMTPDECAAARHEFMSGFVRGLHLKDVEGRGLVAPDPGLP